MALTIWERERVELEVGASSAPMSMLSRGQCQALHTKFAAYVRAIALIRSGACPRDSEILKALGASEPRCVAKVRSRM